MKFILTSILTVFLLNTYAQVTFNVEFPEFLTKNYEFTYTDPDGGWGSPDLENPDNAVLEELKLYSDQNSTSSLACVSPDNENELSGKVALFWRGTCQFSTKALNAQNAGAVACIIINNEPGAGAAGMLPGDDGASVTIPMVMISYEDGEDIIDAMNVSPIQVFIGNKIGFYENDLGLLHGKNLHSQYSSIPYQLAQTETEFDIRLGSWVHNLGSEAQTNVRLSATVRYSNQDLYTEISGPVASLASGDSTYISLPTFSNENYKIGMYNITYKVLSDNPDDYPSDNLLETHFLISADQFAYAKIDKNSHEVTSSGVGYRSTFQSCLVYRNENASRLEATGVNFASFKGPDAWDESLEGEPVYIRVMEWNDPFNDLNDEVNFFDLTEIGFTEYFYPEDLPSTIVTADFDAPLALEDNKRYLFCAYTFNENIFINYNREPDYSTTVGEYLQPINVVRDTDGTYYPMGFGNNITATIGVNMIDVDCAGIDINISGTIDVETISIETITGGLENYTFIWEGDGNINPVEGNDSIVVVDENGEYRLTVIDANGCTGTTLFEVTEIPDPCEGVTIDITGSVAIDTIFVESITGGTGDYDLTWGGTGQVTLIEGTTYLADRNGFYTLTVTDEIGCKGNELFVVEDILDCSKIDIALNGSVIDDTIAFSVNMDYVDDYVFEWDGPGNVNYIDGTEYSYIADANGSYTLTVSYEVECVESDTFVVNTIGVTTHEKSGIIVYPNPTDSKLNFDLTNANTASKIIIYSMTGQELLNVDVDNEFATIDVESFSTGTYIYHVLSNDYQTISRNKFTISK